ncbi:hypothetical protein ACXGQW_01115 [Wenyingzhuangia sp. IMCC45533]
MKFIIILVIIAVTVVTILVVKTKTSNQLESNGIQTTGTVTHVFHRGKLPFCKFSYIVNQQKYIKTQEVAHHLKNEILHKTYMVKYDKNNPNNAIIKLKQEAQ